MRSETAVRASRDNVCLVANWLATGIVVSLRWARSFGMQRLDLRMRLLVWLIVPLAIFVLVSGWTSY
ncbi:MAG TPA: hypothetical protein VGE93_24495, partial [Bryobacteraceae bacterium]